jgi:hypothetical protein
MTCGTGVRQEIIKCLDRLNGKITQSISCKTKLKPDSKNQTCNLATCLPNWQVSEWTSCSKIYFFLCFYFKKAPVFFLRFTAILLTVNAPIIKVN